MVRLLGDAVVKPKRQNVYLFPQMWQITPLLPHHLRLASRINPIRRRRMHRVPRADEHLCGRVYAVLQRRPFLQSYLMRTDRGEAAGEGHRPADRRVGLCASE